jgi:outer membrane receptor protein involved in Fe transport
LHKGHGSLRFDGRLRTARRARIRGGHICAGTPAEGTNTGLEEIIVTVERREERLDKVPISVTAFSQKTMDDLHIENFSDLASIVPGLVLSTPVGAIQDLHDVAIRGIFSGGNSPTTQFYIDETPVAIRTLPAAGPAASPYPLIFDLDRVEVLRGPQGTLFGSGAMGGAIRYITPQPELNDESSYAKVDLSYTDRGAPSYQAGVAYGAPIVSGTAGFRISAWFESQGGFIDKEDPYTGEILKRNANSTDSYVIRPAFTWAPVEGLTITPALFMQHVHSDNPNSYWITELPYGESGAHVSGAIGEPSNDDLNVWSLAIKYNFSGVSFKSDTSYLDRRSVTINDFTHAAQFLYSGNPFVPGLSTSWHDYLNVGVRVEHAVVEHQNQVSAGPLNGLTYRHRSERLRDQLEQYPDLSQSPLVRPDVYRQSRQGNKPGIRPSSGGHHHGRPETGRYGRLHGCILPRCRLRRARWRRHSAAERGGRQARERPAIDRRGERGVLTRYQSPLGQRAILHSCRLSMAERGKRDKSGHRRLRSGDQPAPK